MSNAMLMPKPTALPPLDLTLAPEERRVLLDAVHQYRTLGADDAIRRRLIVVLGTEPEPSIDLEPLTPAEQLAEAQLRG